MIRWLAAVFVSAAACGDNKLVAEPPDAPRPDAAVDMPIDQPPGKPDLVFMSGMMASSLVIMNTTFAPDACELVEQCIGDAGTRRLLRFDTVTANMGTADLMLGMAPPQGVSVPPFEWSPCHGHHHFTHYASYELLDGDNVVVAGHKQAFCLLDTIRVITGAPTHDYTCQNQGISVGWADVYERGLPCQWIDITDVTSGTYTLRVTVNPDGVIDESDTTNNVFTTDVSL